MDDVPPIEHTSISGLRRDLEKLERELKAAEREVEQEGEALKAAREADKRAEAIKRRFGKRVKLQAGAVTERLTKATHRVEELQDDVQLVKGELADAWAANKGRIAKDNSQALSRTSKESLDINEKLAAKLAELSRLRIEKSCLADGKWQPGLEPLVPELKKDRRGDEHLPNGDVMPKMPNGERIPVRTLLALVELYCRPPEEKIVEAPAPPLSRAVVGEGVFAG